MVGSVIRCCKGCNDRTVEPNCHMTCETYLEQKEKQKEVCEKMSNDDWRDFWDLINRNQGPRC